jgi:hypothetical protein
VPEQRANPIELVDPELFREVTNETAWGKMSLRTTRQKLSQSA